MMSCMLQSVEFSSGTLSIEDCWFQSMEFSFVTLSIEDCSLCKCDRVEVYDDSPDAENLIAVYCGSPDEVSMSRLNAMGALVLWVCSYSSCARVTDVLRRPVCLCNSCTRTTRVIVQRVLSPLRICNTLYTQFCPVLMVVYRDA